MFLRVMTNIIMSDEKYHLNETNIMANIRYLPRRGTTREVGGMISTTSRKNT